MATTNRVMTYENLEHRVYEALAHNNLESLKAHLATQNVLDILSPQEVGALLNYMPMDEAARLLAEDVPKRQTELLEVMSPEHAAAVRTLLQYPPESAGRMMTEKFARVQPGLTAVETLAYLRQIHPEAETL